MSRVILEAKTPTERKKITFDFTSLLPSGITLSTAVTTATVYRGVDASPSAVISGATTLAAAVVSQLVIGGTLGVIYNLLCTGTLSDGQVVTLSGLLAVTDTQT